MKKLRSIYKKYMLRPIVYKAVTRGMAAAVLSLLWERYISEGLYSLWQGPGLLCGLAFLVWAWGCYLWLDGVRVRGFLADKGRERAEQKRRHPTHSMVDFADEKIVSFEELEEDERVLCSLTANLVLGVPLTLVGIVASFG